MKYFISLDGGTTNTRLYLVRDLSVIDTERLSVGARNGRAALESALSPAIKSLLSRNSITENEVESIIAFGMITSEYGLCPLDHISLPAGKKELCDSLFSARFDAITSIPWEFIRGVKSISDNLSLSDVMRGEETEIMGIDAGAEDALYILPGSHSKHVLVDKDGRISSFKTLLSGELLAAVLSNTILKDAADFEHNTLVIPMLEKGYEYARAHGINEALFKARILKNFFSSSKEECFSYISGCILCDEVDAVKCSPAKKVVIGGQKEQRLALSHLIGKYTDKEVCILSDEEVSISSAIGAVKIFTFGR